MRTATWWRAGLAVALVAGAGWVAVANGPGGSDAGHDGHAAPAAAVEPAGVHHPTTPPPPSAPLRAGEAFLDLAMPEPYTPSARGTGTDDYRCVLLDPGLTESAFVTGVDVRPGRTDLVHHVILFRVPPEQVAAAQEKDADEPGQGWTCFGGTELDSGGPGSTLDSAPWLGAWAPGGGERVLADGIGTPLEAGSRVVMQVHYNLLAGEGADSTTARLRVAPASSGLQPLETVLLVAPVELPCRPGHDDAPLCDRERAVLDVMARFGPDSGRTVAGLQVLCGDVTAPAAGPVQSCDRVVREPGTLHAAAGHMHLLGRSLTIELNPGTPQARTVLDLPVWDFDDQGAKALPEPLPVAEGDVLRVTCRHDQATRDLLPSFDGQPDRYVVWGEGTTDEMCLGTLLLTRP
ncbi:hypothetical protein [Thalassiella azotivora]